MKTKFLAALTGTVALLLFLNAAHAADSDAGQVRALLKNYERVLNATGDKISEGNQELFVLQKVNGDWKIARYAFSSINPPR